MDIWYQSTTAVWSGVNMAAMTAIKIGYGEGIRSSNDAKSNRFLQGISVEWPYPPDSPIDGMQYTISPCQNLSTKIHCRSLFQGEFVIPQQSTILTLWRCFKL